VISALGRLRQEDCKCEASLCYIGRPCFKTNKIFRSNLEIVRLPMTFVFFGVFLLFSLNMYSIIRKLFLQYVFTLVMQFLIRKSMD
jgi:hypothetical protein